MKTTSVVNTAFDVEAPDVILFSDLHESGSSCLRLSDQENAASLHQAFEELRAASAGDF
jgi:hypothetical protein